MSGREGGSGHQNLIRQASMKLLNEIIGDEWLSITAIKETHWGAKVCMLLPAATSDGWFHDLATLGRITLLRGRITFKNAPSSPRFGSILVHYFQNQLAPDQLYRGIDVGVL